MPENNIPGTEPTGGQTETVTATTEQVATKPEETFTKDKVNELMRRRIERSHQNFFKRYGVKDLKELDAKFSKAVSYDDDQAKIADYEAKMKDMDNRYNDLSNVHKDLNKRYAFISKNINPDKYPDIETYFKGKNLDINEYTLDEELKTHSDWARKVAAVQPLGAESNGQPDIDERALASMYLGVDL